MSLPLLSLPRQFKPVGDTPAPIRSSAQTESEQGGRFACSHDATARKSPGIAGETRRVAFFCDCDATHHITVPPSLIAACRGPRAAPAPVVESLLASSQPSCALERSGLVHKIDVPLPCWIQQIPVCSPVPTPAIGFDHRAIHVNEASCIHRFVDGGASCCSRT